MRGCVPIYLYPVSDSDVHMGCLKYKTPTNASIHVFLQFVMDEHFFFLYSLSRQASVIRFNLFSPYFKTRLTDFTKLVQILEITKRRGWENGNYVVFPIMLQLISNYSRRSFTVYLLKYLTNMQETWYRCRL